ncbi:ribosomal protection-like ABC-F family protein [Egbenema bharatensis]|uniref:ribosomal protection-like ABC-F family protein n=1 Tax=Egbenema bharatensis TaxID=3463334 RepID=UPI003A895426
MSNHSQPCLLAEQLAYDITPTQRLFQNVHLSIAPTDRIALVGPNGAGKSTLLKILSGQISPTSGSVYSNGTIYYLPQISTLHQQLQTRTVLDVLSTALDEWWTVTHVLESTFNTSIDLTLPIATLSGGELTKLFLAMGLAQQPNVLLLDEPTNHMDYLALEELRQFLVSFNGAFVIVSHKPFFLDQVVHTTWELSSSGLTVYGGNFSLYREQKQRDREAQLRSHEVARKELKRAKTAALQEQKRVAQSRKTGQQSVLRGKVDKLTAGRLKNSAELTSGKLKQKHEAAIAEATEKMAETKIRTSKAAKIQLEERNLKRRTLVEIQGASLRIDDRWLIQNLQLHLAIGDRLAIAGANGSGKSSLAKAVLRLSDAATLEGGRIQTVAAMNVVYLDQTYALIDRTKTILENMQTVNKNLPYQQIRQQLGHFLFFNQDVYKLASRLSGGELARLAIAMITIAEIDLLILDEPTNNLDVPTVDQLVNAVKDYQGALWVISHDLDFLSHIQITRSFQIKDRSLQPTTYLPRESQSYYRELVGN